MQYAASREPNFKEKPHIHFIGKCLLSGQRKNILEYKIRKAVICQITRLISRLGLEVTKLSFPYMTISLFLNLQFIYSINLFLKHENYIFF